MNPCTKTDEDIFSIPINELKWTKYKKNDVTNFQDFKENDIMAITPWTQCLSITNMRINYENEPTPPNATLYIQKQGKTRATERLPKPLFPCGLAVRGRPCWGSCPALFSCSNGDMLPLPPVDLSLVVLGYAQVLRPEGKLVLYHSHGADITEETSSGSAFAHGNIIIVVVVKIEM